MRSRKPEYRVRIKALERQVTTLGGTPIVPKKGAAKSLKRGIDDADIKEIYTALILHTHKRIKTSAEEQPTTPAQLSSSSNSSSPLGPLPTPSRSPRTSPPKPALGPAYTTPTRKADRANFSNKIPLGQEHKFASTLLNHPTKLFDPTNTSHVTSVLQCLAAVPKPHEMWTDLSETDKQAFEFRLLSNKLRIDAIEDEVSQCSNIPASKAFIDSIAEAQHFHGRSLNTYPLQHHLANPSAPASSVKDPEAYLHHVLSKVSTQALKEAFEAPTTYHINCVNCNGIPTYGDNEIGPDNFKYTPPTTMTSPSYTTTLTPFFTQHEMNYKGATNRTLPQLLQEKFANPIHTSCKKCRDRNTSNSKRTWVGYAYAPNILTFSFPWPAEKKIYISLPLEHDFSAYVRASSEKSAYRLVSMVKKLRSGEYACFVHGEDGKWWKCIVEQVRECEIKDWQGDERNGETVLAMYEKGE
ncbi:hypothetical protein EK21DRAFT_110226 [Setomelanomma holmii]|uniref:USP domain-containing protein n=1 Tax=Setomelanomma holmii TaxID=210430 RepID=A0A9P4LM61_9PLEO|nr:hypothetical protein EK21DRAFT_110226 [Setomelanomma holmii]